MKRKELGKLCNVAIGVILCLSLFLPIEIHGASSFKDIKGHWAENYIEIAVSQGIIKGYTDGRFLPDEKVTRAEFISMLNRALGNTSLGSVGFNDVGRNAWYYNDVGKSVTAGFVSGFGDGSFRPNAKITRQEAAVMLSRIVPTYGYSANLKKFADHGNIAGWAYESLQKISGKGYISGYTDGKVHPLDSLTRAQAAKIISDIVKNEKIVTTDPIVKKNNTKLAGTIYANNVTIHKDLDDGSAAIDNCIILGKLIVQGGGDETVTINNSRIVDALINRTADPVRVLAKGETVICNVVCTGEFALQTTGLSGNDFGTGFAQVGLTSSAKGTLQGAFPKISLNGSSADLRLLNGTIKNLEVNSTGKKSSIYVESKGTIEQADVYGESYFKGVGTISNMQVYAKGITYETKPKKWTIHSGGETPTKSDPELTLTFEPVSGKTNIYLDAKITVTCSSTVKEKDGSTITNGRIPDIISIRRGSANGSTVAYSGSINSAKTVMTLTPSSLLEEKTKYYIVVKAGTMRNEYGDRNEEVISYFTTGVNTEKLVVTYSPQNGETNIPVDRKSFTIKFSEAITRSNGKSIDSDYLIDGAIVFQKGNSNISKNDYTVSINSRKDIITVTLNKNYTVTLGTKYSLGISSSYLKTAGGTAIPASKVTWTTAGTPVLSNISATAYEQSIDMKVTPNVNGTVYAILSPANEGEPSAAQIRDGKNKSGGYAVANAESKVSASAAAVLSLKSVDISRDTQYKIYAVLYDGNNNTSKIISASVKTEPLKLKALTVIPVKDGIEYSDVLLGKFNLNTKRYDVLVDNGTDSIKVNAEPNAEGFPGDLTVNGQYKEANVPIEDGKVTVTVIIKEEGKTAVEYIVNVKEKGTADLLKMTINDDPYTPDGKTKYSLGEDYDKKLKLVITAKEMDAKIRIGSNSVTYDSGEAVEWTLASTTTELRFTIESSDGKTTKSYDILFDRSQAPKKGPDGAYEEDDQE